MFQSALAASHGDPGIRATSLSVLVWTPLRAALAALAIAALIPFSATAQQGPEAKTAARGVVESFYDSLLHVMRNAQELGFQGRYDTLDGVIRTAYNLPAMAKAAVAGEWQRLSAEQRQMLVDAFSRMSIATYASRFDGYGGEKLEVLDTQDGPRGTLVVKTRIVKSDGEAVTLNYLMREYEKHWRIIDVFLKGTISELAKNRSEYGAVMKREGFDSLIAKINAKVAELGNS